MKKYKSRNSKAEKINSYHKRLEKEPHKLWCEIIFARVGYKCEYQGCYNTDRLSPRHAFTKGAHSSVRYDPNNGIALCYYHHKGSKVGAHNDNYFKDKIAEKYPVF